MSAKILTLTAITLLSVDALAGRAPDVISSVEFAGKGYVQLNRSAESKESGYDYQVVSTADIKRLVGGSDSKVCYMFYFTGTELLKIRIDNQPCKSVVAVLVASQP